MRPVHIVFLVLAGALGGAAVMKVIQLRPESEHKLAEANPAAPRAAAPAAIPAPAPEPAAAAEPTPAPPVEAAPAAKPAPPAAPARRPSRPSPFHPRTLAGAQPPAQAVPWARPSDPPPAPAADPEPVAPAPPPIPEADSEPMASAAVQRPAPQNAAPPARPETENATPPPAPSERTPNTVTLNAGLLLPVRLLDGLSSDRNAAGDRFSATLDHELVVDGFVIAERGARVEGRVVASNPGKPGSAAGIAIELTRLNTSDGQQVAIQTDSFEKHAELNRNADIETVAGGAVLGAAIGGMVGGGKGAAIGAGAGAGAGSVALSRTRPAALPSESRVTFRLRTPVTLTERLGG